MRAGKCLIVMMGKCGPWRWLPARHRPSSAGVGRGLAALHSTAHLRPGCCCKILVEGALQIRICMQVGHGEWGAVFRRGSRRGSLVGESPMAEGQLATVKGVITGGTVR